jgi:hypothetical protein
MQKPARSKGEDSTGAQASRLPVNDQVSPQKKKQGSLSKFLLQFVKRLCYGCNIVSRMHDSQFTIHDSQTNMALDRKWEKYRGGPAAVSKNSIRVTINHKGMIYMNAKTYTALGRPEAVALYYNREEDAIAVEPANPRSIENFPVVERLNGRAINSGSFCRQFGIKIPLTQRFIRPDITNDGHLILALRETVTIGGYKKGYTKKT